jgi:hypothetical protein
MIEPKQYQPEPCVALHIEDDGLTMDVSAKLRQGARLWTPEEAGQWFKEQWEDARNTLHTSTVVRLMNDGSGRQMVRHGQVAWAVTEAEATPERDAAPAAVPGDEAPSAGTAATGSRCGTSR